MSSGPRKENESFNEYRQRLNEEQKQQKVHAAGVLIWPAKNGTYEKAKHGPIGSRK